MDWYWILLIVVGCLVALYFLGFIFFISNGDGKMIEHVYNWLQRKHDKSKKEEKI